MADPFDSHAKTAVDPADQHFLITPNDGADLAVRPRAIYCEDGGTIVIRDRTGVDLTYTMGPGQVLTLRGVRVMATGTTGTFYGWL